MGYPTKVQFISRKASEQYYINFPSALAQAMEFSKGESVEWVVADKSNLILTRAEVPPNPVDIHPQRRQTPVSAIGDIGAPRPRGALTFFRDSGKINGCDVISLESGAGAHRTWDLKIPLADRTGHCHFVGSP